METNMGPLHRERRGVWNPYEILNRLENFDVDYGIKGIWNFSRQFENQIKKRPNKIHVLGLIGEPVSGKSVTQWQILKWLLRDEGEIARLRDKGYGVRVDNLPWGDAFLAIPDGLRPNVSMTAHELQEQQNRAEAVFRRSLTQTIQGYYKDPHLPEKQIRIITFDIPGFTGVYVKPRQTGPIRIPQAVTNLIQRIPIFRRESVIGERIGTVRALMTIQELVNQTGSDFGQLKDLYDKPFILGLVASDRIRKKGKKVRKRLIESQTIKEKRRALEESGMILQPNADVVSYGKEDARVDDIGQIEQELNSTIILLQLRGLIPSTFYNKSGNNWLPLTAGLLRAFPEDRARVIGEYVLPFFARDQLKISPKRMGIFFNSTYLKFIHLYREVPEQHFPIRELHNIRP